MTQAMSCAQIANPEAIVLHNIGIWRDAGYSDTFIARSMVEPPLKSKKDYERWGLKWGGAKPLPCTRQRRSKVTPEIALAAIEAAISFDGMVTSLQLVSQLQTGQDTLARIRAENLEVDEAYSRLMVKNRKFRLMSQNRSAPVEKALGEAEAVLAKAIEDRRKITGADICLAIGKSKSWLSLGIHKKWPRAIALKNAINAHNQSLRDKP